MGKEKEERENVKLSWRDYVAFVIALLTTSFLPYFLLIFALLIMLVIFLSLV